MNSFIFLLLITTICCDRVHRNTAATIENSKMVRRSIGMSTPTSNENQTQLKIEQLKRTANAKVDSSSRKAKILRSLAFLAGLSVGGLAGAPSNGNAYNKGSSMALNFDASRVSPHIAAIYNPYPYVSHPYVLATPLGLYPLLNPLGVQLLNLLENKKPTDMLNNNDEYIEEAKRVENVKASNDVVEETDGNAELQVDEDRNAEEKKLNVAAACDLRNGFKQKHNDLLESASRERENAYSSLVGPSVRAVDASRQNNLRTNTTNTTNTTNINATSPEHETMRNSTMHNNGTTNPPFHGYYGGHPQDIHHIAFTTETNRHKYHDYEHINYNLPSYDKPASFYPDERYNYYFNPSVDSSLSNEFRREQMPEYFPNDFNRFLYTSYNTLPLAENDFQPVA